MTDKYDERAGEIERAFLDGHPVLKTMTMRSFIAAALREAGEEEDDPIKNKWWFKKGKEIAYADAAKIADKKANDVRNIDRMGRFTAIAIADEIRARAQDPGGLIMTALPEWTNKNQPPLFSVVRSKLYEEQLREALAIAWEALDRYREVSCANDSDAAYAMCRIEKLGAQEVVK